MKMPALTRPLASLAIGALLLAGCGGGGDGPSSRFPASSQYAGVCTVEGQKLFVRSYLDEVYLWYNEVPEVDASKYATPEAYFDALLVRPKDEFSAAFYTGPTPRPTTSPQPAQAAMALADLLATHSGAITASRTVQSPGGRTVGYVQLDHLNVGAQDDLITAFQQLRSQGIQDLVLDLRRNTGGFLYIALAAASMIAGPQNEGQVFEQLRYSDKRSDVTAASTFRFSSKLQFSEGQYAEGTQLPQFGLPRVFVLTSPSTCSASESIINALRGIDVQVVRIGDNTCGKPYGFREQLNCNGTYHYFAIEFQGFNAKGFGDYQGSGFTPTCRVADGGTRGDTASDRLLRGALEYADTGACPAGSATGVQSASTPILTPNRTQSWGARLLLPQQRP